MTRLKIDDIILWLLILGNFFVPFNSWSGI